ncbi:hypothetical protein KC799_24130 [candidate division KSB1 bacterium]|nr:hypothetical protein [candidate division KSB1 bacterium]
MTFFVVMDFGMIHIDYFFSTPANFIFELKIAMPDCVLCNIGIRLLVG